MTENNLENELKYLEISVEKLKLMALKRKRETGCHYRGEQCTDTDVERVCNSIRKSSLIIKKHAHLVGRYR